MKKLKGIDVTKDLEGKRISLLIGETYIIGNVVSVRPPVMGAPGIIIENLFTEIPLYQNQEVTVFGDE